MRCPGNCNYYVWHCRVPLDRLYLFAYRVQIAQELKLGDKPYGWKFAVDMPQHINMYPSFLPSILFSDEVTCYHAHHLCTLDDNFFTA
jgi:hypothetical protein